MGRIFTSGMERNGDTEWSATSGARTYSTTIVRSGTYSGVTTPQTGSRQSWAASWTNVSNGPFWVRGRFRYRAGALPSLEDRILALCAGASVNSAHTGYLTIDSTGVLRLYSDSGVVIGSPSGILVPDAWNRVELHYDRTPAGGSQVLDARVEGVQFAGATNLTFTNQVRSLALGTNLNQEANVGGAMYIDDIAVNDSSGSVQNGFPGEGKVAASVLPTGAGDNSMFALGGSSPAATAWQSLLDQPSDDAVTFISSATLNNITDVAVTPGADLLSTDTITLVQVGVRWAGAAASANASFVARLKAASGGTVTESAPITPSAVTYSTGIGGTSGVSYPITSYTKNGTNAWTKADLATAQIGVRISTGNTNAAIITAMWLTVEYTRAGVTRQSMMLLGVN